MADEKDIRDNLSYYSKIFDEVLFASDRLQDFFDESETIKSEIRNKAREYAIDTVDQMGIYRIRDVSIDRVKLPFNEDHYNESIVRSLYKLMGYLSFKRAVKDNSPNLSNIDKYLDDASIILKGEFAWMLARNEKRSRAVSAMNKIEHLYQSKYVDFVDDYIERFRSFDLDESVNAFVEHTKDFVDLLNKVTGMSFYLENDPERPDFVDLQKYKKGYEKTVSVLKDIVKDSEKIIRNVQEKAANMANKEALNILEDVSVDEINRDKKGIRTSALKNAGIETLADVIRKSEYSISSIYGISEMNAHIIKKYAQETWNRTRNTVKLKISSDNKTKESTQLLDSLYTYIQNKEIIKTAEDLYYKYGQHLESILKTISDHEDEYMWLYHSDKQKKILSDCFILFEDLTKTRYIGQVGDLVKQKNSIVSNRLSDSQLWDFFEQNSARCISELEELLPGYFGNTDTFYGLPEDLAEKVQEECLFPDGLLVTLRRYQEWGVKYILHQKKVLLGDEMGLGKTIQAIAAMVSLRNVGEDRFLVVCPASVIINWCREIEHHSKLKAVKIHGAGRLSAYNNWIKAGGVGVTTYETLNSLSVPDDFKYSMLVVDEAHYVKNPDAHRTQNVIDFGKKTDRILYMTGTPLENKVDEMIELINQLQPELTREIQSYSYMSASEIFRQKVAPVYYRRKREDVLTELPELIEEDAWCETNKEEKEIYEKAVLSRNSSAARRVSWSVDDLSKSSKAARLKEIAEEVREDGRKLIVFSFYRDTISKLYEYFHEICLFPITGSVNVKKRQEIIDEFDKAPAGTMLISQIQAGGTGLNIQAASVVVITEPQVKPSIENQAISRAYRMGQTRNVLVYRLLCENTIDERIHDILKQKQEIFDAFADKSVAASASLEIDNKTVGDLIQEEIERIGRERGIDPEELRKTMSNKKYYDSLMPLSYAELVESLQNKYGLAEGDFFLTETCKSRNSKITRTGEGLFIHHIDENKHIMLSDSEHAVNRPFEYQKADRLVYCNFLEHLLLHIKIVEEYSFLNFDLNDPELAGIGGAVNFIIKQVNDLFDGKAGQAEYIDIAFSVISNDYESYIMMLKQLLRTADDNPIYASLISKDSLSKGWEGNIVEKVHRDLAK